MTSTMGIEEANPLRDAGAEQCVLGSMLISPQIIADVAEILPDAGAFFEPRHQKLYSTIVEMHAAGDKVSAPAIISHLIDNGGVHPVGGAPYLSTLMENTPSSASGTHFAQAVADRAMLRALDEACDKVRRMIRSASGTSAEIVERARELVVDLAGRAAATNGPARWGDMIDDGLQRYQERSQHEAPKAGIPTGLKDLDRVIKGIHLGRVYVIAGESGAGKSILAVDFVRSAAFHNNSGALVFNMEMTRTELFDRVLCAEAGVDHTRAVEGNLTDNEWAKLATCTGVTEDAPLWLDDTARLTVADIRARAQRYKREHDIKLIVVDLIGLVTAHDRRLPRQEQVAEISRRLQQLAVELEIAVVVVAQINRNNQQRADKRPSIHDLRESAQIGHDAAVVILVHRPEKHDRTKRPNEADLIIDKNRFGPETDITVCAQLHYSRFASFAIN
jgi:replicative DNA helicase